MKLLEHKDIDFKKWDSVILESEWPLVFGQSFYLNATCPGWKALVLENYRSIMPVTSNRKYGLSYLMQPPFTPQLGVFGGADEDTVRLCMEYLEKLFKFIYIELNAGNVFRSSSAKSKRTFIIDFRLDYRYNTNTKRNIARAEKLGLQMEEISGKDILILSGKYLDPFLRKKLKITTAHIRIFHQLLVNSLNENCLKSLLVKDGEGKVCAIAHFISNGKHVVYLKGANFDRNSGSMHFLMHKALEYYRHQKLSFFDFGGGQSDSLAQFYSGFGAKPVNYQELKLNALPRAVRWLKK